MAGSWIRYNITRPYPYRWITPVVVAGLLVFLVLFSILNTVALGFDYVSLTTADPNATTVQDSWYTHWPSWVSSRVQPICQDTELLVGSRFATNKSALTYTITDVWRANDSSDINGALMTLPSLIYHNNVLESCNVSSVEIDFDSLGRTATQQVFSEWGAVVRSYITCTISDLSAGVTYLNMTQEYDYVPASASLSDMYEFLGTNFLTRSLDKKQALYWGESLLSMYWAYTSQSMANIRANQTTNDEPGIRTGTVAFTSTNLANPPNITDFGFFRTDYRFFVDQGQPGNYTLISPRTVPQEYDIGALIANEAYPNVWQQADVLAKAAYSTVLTDLGVPDSSTTPNIIQNPDLLAYFTANFSEARHNIANAYPGPSDFQYLNSDGSMAKGLLETNPSVLSTTYLCQVPHRKPAGTLFVLVLVADTVLLQVLWWLFSGAVGLFALRRQRDSDACLGCTSRVSPVPYAPIGGAMMPPGGRYVSDTFDPRTQRGEGEAPRGSELELGHLPPPSMSVDISRGRSVERSLSRERLIEREGF